MQKTVDGTATDYVYSGNYVIAETGKTYLRGLSYHAVTNADGTFYYFCNAHGDVTGIVNNSGESVAAYDYDEFGNLTEETGDFNNDIKYAGEFFDSESENYYLRSRYYDPTIGRFTQQDTFLGVDDNPLSLNRYTYCHNNPIRFVDPSGFAIQKIKYTLEGEDYSYYYDDTLMSEEEKAYINAFKSNCNSLEGFLGEVMKLQAGKAIMVATFNLPNEYGTFSDQEYGFVISKSEDIPFFSQELEGARSGQISFEQLCNDLQARQITVAEVTQYDRTGVYYMKRSNGETNGGAFKITARIKVDVDGSIVYEGDAPFAFLNADSSSMGGLGINGDYGVKMVDGKLHPAVNVFQYSHDDGFGDTEEEEEKRVEANAVAWEEGIRDNSVGHTKYIDNAVGHERIVYNPESGANRQVSIRNVYYKNVELPNDVYLVLEVTDNGNGTATENYKLYAAEGYMGESLSTPLFEYEVTAGENPVKPNYSNLTLSVDVSIAQNVDKDHPFQENTGSVFTANVIGSTVYSQTGYASLTKDNSYTEIYSRVSTTGSISYVDYCEQSNDSVITTVKIIMGNENKI